MRSTLLRGFAACTLLIIAAATSSGQDVQTGQQQIDAADETPPLAGFLFESLVFEAEATDGFSSLNAEDGMTDTPPTLQEESEIGLTDQVLLAPQGARTPALPEAEIGELQIRPTSNLDIDQIRDRLNVLGLPGYCQLSNSPASSAALSERLQAVAVSNRRIFIEGLVPCDALLAFTQMQAPRSLFTFELIDLPPGVTGAQFVGDIRTDFQTQTLEAVHLRTQTQPLAAYADLSVNALVMDQDQRHLGSLVLFQGDTLTSTDLNGAGARQTFAVFIGFVPVGQQVLIVTLNGGADPEISIAQMLTLFDLAFAEASLRFLDQN